MKKILSLSFSLLLVGTLFAEDSIRYSYDANLPSYVSFEVGDSARVARQKSMHRRLTATQILLRYLPLNAESSVLVVDTITDDFDNRHVRFEQHYNGLRIDGQRFYLHYNGIEAQSMNGNFRTVSGLNSVPTITEQNALQSALNSINATEYAWQNDTAEMLLREDYEDSLVTYYPTGELLVWFDTLQVAKLVYKFKILALQPSGSYTVFVNAHSGKVESIENNEEAYGQYTGSADTRFYGTKSIITDKIGSKYRLHDHSRGHIITRNMKGKRYATSSPNYYDNDNNWTAAEYHSNKTDAALTAHWAAEMTYDYFKTKFGRKGWNGKNGVLRLYVNAPLKSDNGNNAYWNGWGITCGIGTGEPYVALDIVAHEIGHAIMDKTANLKYRGESGALNEGFSDIWGACIQHYAFPTKGDSIWLHGIDRGICNRNLKDPKSEGAGSPDTYGNENWISTSSSCDNGGVHRNSTVFSHWFYLLVQGGSGKNDINNSYSVNGIGIDKAARIAYNMLTSGLTENSDFADARRVSIAKAQSYGKNSPEAIAVQNAWYAVGVGLPYIEIVGPDYMCEEATYSLRNLPEGASVTWSKSRGITLEDENEKEVSVYRGVIFVKTNRLISVSRPFSGHAVLTATITIDGETIVVKKTIEVRKNTKPEIERDTTRNLASRVTQVFSVTNYAESDSANLLWTISRGSNIVYTAYGQSISYTPALGNYRIIVKNIDGCEPDNSDTLSFSIRKIRKKMVYANPASYSVDVSILEQYDDEATIGISNNGEPYEGKYTLELWSELYGCVRTVNGVSSASQISLSGLTPGTYFIKLLIDGALETTQQLIIQ